MRIVKVLVVLTMLGCTGSQKESEISTSNDEVVSLFEQFRQSAGAEREKLGERLAKVELTDTAREEFATKCGDSLQDELLSKDLTAKYWLIVFTGNLKSTGLRYLETLDELKRRNKAEISSKSFKTAIEPAQSKIRSAK